MNPGKILVVDDSQLLHRMYDLTLLRYRQKGCEVFHSFNGREGVDQLEREPTIELVLLDIHMPVLDGLETLRILQAKGWLDRGRVIVVSTEGREKDLEAARALGAHGYVTKPIHARRLHGEIERLLGIKPHAIASARIFA